MRVLTQLTSIVLLLALAGGAAAQFENLKNTTPEQRAKIQTALMKEKLGLTADEEGKIAALNLKYAEKMQPILQEGGFKQMRDMRAVNGEKEKELKTVLSPAQFTQYIASKDEIRKKFEERIAAGQ
jgi:hypothetical protein